MNVLIDPKLRCLCRVLDRYGLDPVAAELVDGVARVSCAVPPGRRGLLVLEFLAWAINRDWGPPRHPLSIDAPPPYLNTPGRSLRCAITVQSSDVDDLVETLAGHLADGLFVPRRRRRG